MMHTIVIAILRLRSQLKAPYLCRAVVVVRGIRSDFFQIRKEVSLQRVSVAPVDIDQ